MSKREALIITPMLVIFIFHGLLYYIYPEYHYLTGGSDEGYIAYVKYACVLLALPAALTLPEAHAHRAWITTGVGIILLNALPYAHWASEGNILLLQYIVPTLAFFYAPYAIRLFRNTSVCKRLALITILTSAGAVVFEYANEGFFTSFSRSGIRTAGPFINPNNTAIVVSLLASFFHYRFKGMAINLIVAACCVLVLVLSGSKTGIFIYAVGWLASQKGVSKISVSILLFAVFFTYASDMVSSGTQNDLRGISLESAIIRLDDNRFLLQTIYHGQLADFFFGFSAQSLVDNAYLDIFSFGGIYLLIIFCTLQIWTLFVCGKYGLIEIRLFLLLIFLAMLSTNLPRLWPLAYVYWALVGAVVFLRLEVVSADHINTRLRMNLEYVH